eukprot:212243_1
MLPHYSNILYIEIDMYIHTICVSFEQTSYHDIINSDVIQSIVMFCLPVQSYQTIRRVVEKLEKDELENNKHIPFVFVMEEANRCLNALIALKKELICEEKICTAHDVNDDDLYPFGDHNKVEVAMEKILRFIISMSLCNLLELCMSDGVLYLW